MNQTERTSPWDSGEPCQQRLRVNQVAAVATPGAQALVGKLLAEHPELVEPVEWLAEAVFALATCDPRRCTGRVLYSGPFLDEIGRKP
jgi:citronellol/citronellal dehydrogenase